MTIQDCVTKVGRLQQIYNGTKSDKGIVTTIIPAPKGGGANEIGDYLKEVLKSNNFHYSQAVTGYTDFEPLVLYGKFPMIAYQWFDEAFPNHQD